MSREAIITPTSPTHMRVLTAVRPPERLSGEMRDLNCDGWIDFNDINPLVLALANWEEWKRRYADCPEQNADVNADGIYGGANGFGDINPFIKLLSSSGGHPILCE